MSKTSLWHSLTLDQKDRVSEYFGCSADLFDAAFKNELVSARLATLGDAWLSLIFSQTCHPAEHISKARGYYVSNEILGWFLHQIVGHGAHFSNHKVGDFFESALYITSHPQVAQDGSTSDPFDIECTPDGYERSVRCVLAMKRWAWSAGMGMGNDWLVKLPQLVPREQLMEGVEPIGNVLNEISKMRSTMIFRCKVMQNEVRLQRAGVRVTAMGAKQYGAVQDLMNQSDRDASLAVLDEKGKSVTQSVNRSMMNSSGVGCVDDDDDYGDDGDGNTADDEAVGGGGGGLLDSSLQGNNNNNDDDDGLDADRRRHLQRAQNHNERAILPWKQPLEQGWTNEEQHRPPRVPCPGSTFRPHCRRAVRVRWETRNSKVLVTPRFHPCCGAPEGFPCSCRVGEDTPRHCGHISLTRENKYDLQAMQGKGMIDIVAVWSCCNKPVVSAAPAPLIFSIVPESSTGCIGPRDPPLPGCFPPPRVPEREVYRGIPDPDADECSHGEDASDVMDLYYARERERSGKGYVWRPCSDLQQHVPGRTKLVSPRLRQIRMRHVRQGAIEAGVDLHVFHERRMRSQRERRLEARKKRELQRGEDWTVEKQAAFAAEDSSGDEEYIMKDIVPFVYAGAKGAGKQAAKSKGVTQQQQQQPPPPPAAAAAAAHHQRGFGAVGGMRRDRPVGAHQPSSVAPHNPAQNRGQQYQSHHHHHHHHHQQPHQHQHHHHHPHHHHQPHHHHHHHQLHPRHHHHHQQQQQHQGGGGGLPSLLPTPPPPLHHALPNPQPPQSGAAHREHGDVDYF